MICFFLRNSAGVVLGRSLPVLLLKAFGEVRRVGEAYSEGYISDVTRSLGQQIGRPFQPDGSDLVSGRVIGKVFEFPKPSRDF